MTNPRLASRYAKSILVLAEEKGQLEAVYADMKYLQAVCRQSAEFVRLLKSPIIKTEKKTAIIEAVTKGKISQISTLFIELLVKKGREDSLPEIVHSFIDQYNEMKGIHRVKLTTAVPVSDGLKEAIIEKTKKEANLPVVELESVVDPGLVGGFILEFNNKLFDASIIRDLRDIKKQFSENVYIQNIR